MDNSLLQLLKDFGNAFNSHNADNLVSMMTDDAIFYTVAGDGIYGNEIVGKDAIKKAFNSVWDIMPDANWATGNIFVSGNMGLSEWVFSGTNKNDGSRIEAQGCDVFTFQNGKIMTKNAFRKQRPVIKP